MSAEFFDDPRWLAPPRVVKTDIGNGGFVLRSPEPLGAACTLHRRVGGAVGDADAGRRRARRARRHRPVAPPELSRAARPGRCHRAGPARSAHAGRQADRHPLRQRHRPRAADAGGDAHRPRGLHGVERVQPPDEGLRARSARSCARCSLRSFTHRMRRSTARRSALRASMRSRSSAGARQTIPVRCRSPASSTRAKHRRSCTRSRRSLPTTRPSTC